MDPLLGWLLYLHPALGLLIISLIISIITTLAIKFLTNQTLMKDLRNELKELQKEMKELKNNPKKMAKINEKVMETNSKYMSHSMRPTFFTLIPILLIFGWLSSHIGYYPLMPGENFELTAVFEEGADGEITLQLPEGLNLVEGENTRNVLSNEISWIISGEEGEYFVNLENGFNSIKLSNKEVKPFEDVPVIKHIPLISGFNWFWTYFIFSLGFSMGLRRLLNLY